MMGTDHWPGLGSQLGPRMGKSMGTTDDLWWWGALGLWQTVRADRPHPSPRLLKVSSAAPLPR